MKPCVLLSLALVFGGGALSQQPADWRPNVSEDNKAATWEQTFDFLADTLRFHSGGTVTKVSSIRHCFITVELGPASAPESRTFYLDRVDPLSIKVVPRSDGIGSVVMFAGSNNAPYGVMQNLRSGAAASFHSIVDMSTLDLEDQELAKRTSRALMHAALLCGGSKAVSPF
jgi:hypothetical protein